MEQTEFQILLGFPIGHYACNTNTKSQKNVIVIFDILSFVSPGIGPRPIKSQCARIMQR